MRERPHKVTEERKKAVKGLSMLGKTQEEIAGELRVDLKTLRKYYRKELDAHKHAQKLLAQSLWSRAMDDERRETAVAIFVAKTQLGWRETNPEELMTTDLSALIRANPQKALEYLRRLEAEALNALCEETKPDGES